MHELDDPEVRARLDPEGMLERIREQSQRCRDAWRAAWEEAQNVEANTDIDKVVVLGMGGSAIGGDLLQALAALESPVPIMIHRGYDLPPFVDERTLVIASSYSGNTEETVTAFQQSFKSKGPKLVIASGGELKSIAEQKGVPALIFQCPPPPRGALAYVFLFEVAVAQKFGILKDKSGDVEEAAAVIQEMTESSVGEQVPYDENPAKQLAQRLHGKLPVIYGASFLTPVARRWKTQFNENANVWSFFEELPEANHNAIVGYELPEALRDVIVVIFLRSSNLHPRVLLRYKATEDRLREVGVETAVVESKGESVLAQMLSTSHVGDYTSYYLAMLNHVSPMDVGPLDDLKALLAREGAS